MYSHSTPKGWLWIDNPCKVGVKILMQFTGLHDKNGVPIYEGDILGYWGQAKWPIKWFDGSARFGFYYLDNPEIPQFFVNPKEVRKKQVIGNIYENPELLNDKK